MSRSRAVGALCSTALALDENDGQRRKERRIQVYRLGEEPTSDELTRSMPLEDRVALVSELSEAAYALRGEHVVPGVRRDVPVPFLGRKALVANKRAVGRPQDIADVTMLMSESKARPTKKKKKRTQR